MRAALDHLVIAARTLDEGVAWCEARLGITPAAGGRHTLMSTCNRLFSIASPQAPRAYGEIIAIDRDAPEPGRTRWFDLDSPDMHRRLDGGPQLITGPCAAMTSRRGASGCGTREWSAAR